MDGRHKVRATGERAVGAVVLCIGVAAFGVLLFASRKLMLLDRALDAGDIAVLGVLAIFGTFCALIGWPLFRTRPAPAEPDPVVSSPAEDAPRRRVKLSHAFAAAGVLLLILSVSVPWQPVVLLFLGLALLAVSHALTPCVERMEQLRKARGWERQL
jgi:formate hydrogenlyase subunit 3/multisubunit Na+/H+ antiporter MnhD subunit